MHKNTINQNEVSIYNSLESFENCSTMANLPPSSLANMMKHLQLKTDHYKEEIARMKAIIEKLGITNSSAMLDMMDSLNKMKEELNVEQLMLDSAVLSHTQQIRKNKYYLLKLNACIKIYTNLNEDLTKNLKALKIAHEASKSELEELLVVTKEEVKVMESKLQRHENDLIKLEKKYPWLKSKDNELANISKAISTLNDLKLKKKQLLDDLNIFEGLKPDIGEATEQVNALKNELAEVKSMMQH